MSILAMPTNCKTEEENNYFFIKATTKVYFSLKNYG